MSFKRESLFPSGSLGRSSSPLPRTASHESLSAHPLLSPPPASPAQATFGDTSASGSPRYVPYTPRQRVAPTSATTGTTVHPSISAAQPQSAQGDATSKLQLMNLKAAAQRVGLDAASIGWAILERLSNETDHGPEWNDIWSALSVSKATLLLPLDQHRTNELITPEFIKDHIALCDNVVKGSGAIVTLSGLRGAFTDTTLTIRSSISPSSEPFQALLAPATRSSVFSSLPPLPAVLVSPSTPIPTSPSSSTSSIPTSPQYPIFSIPSHAPVLPLPPRPSATKPPLPPRPGTRATSGPTHPASRLTNSFASLFGRATPPASPSNPPVALHPEGHAPPSSSILTPNVSGSSAIPIPQGTIPTTGGTERQGVGLTEHVLEVPAYTLSMRIDRAAIGRALSDAITGEMRAALWDAGVPSWAVECVERFAKPLHPLVRMTAGTSSQESTAKDAEANTGSVSRVSKIKSRTDVGEWIVRSVSPDERTEDLAGRFQEFYAELEEALWERLPKDPQKRWGRRGLHFGGSKHGEKHANGILVVDSASVSGEGSEPDESIEEKGGGEEEGEKDAEGKRGTQIRGIMDAVERVLCSLFYDRLFLPANSDDISHDEALSSRIAAVNLLDLGLTHLGVDVGRAGKEVEAVVMECGNTLGKLDGSCRAPADKAAILVAVHKIIVDGLSKLPPIGLKPEDDILDEKTPRAVTSFNRGEVHDDPGQEVELELRDQTYHDSDVTIAGPSSTALSPVIVLSPEELLEDAKLPLHTESLEHPPSPRITPSVHSGSTLLTTSPRSTSPTPVSGDVILPLMIFAVVKANPPRLVSNLLYIQRFRRENAGSGEEGYCLINLMAVAEFLENVDLAALGLGESEKTVLSASQLSPIPLARSVRGSEPTSPQVTQASLRGRVEQQVDAIAGSANKVISGVVDSSFGVLRSLLPGQSQPSSTPHGETTEEPSVRPGFGILRRDTGFSIASLAASLPGSRSRPSGQNEESGQQMMEVPSRPGSSRSMHPGDENYSGSEADSAEEEDDDDDDEEADYGHDTRSIRSFESMMSGKTGRHKGKRRPMAGRMSLTDRLASMPGLSRLSQTPQHEAAKVSPPGSRRTSLLLPTPPVPNRSDTPASSRAQSPVAIRISPPNPRFLTCTEDDIKVSEVGELLREYKRLAEAVRAMGGFHDD